MSAPWDEHDLRKMEAHPPQSPEERPETAHGSGEPGRRELSPSFPHGALLGRLQSPPGARPPKTRAEASGDE